MKFVNIGNLGPINSLKRFKLQISKDQKQIQKNWPQKQNNWGQSQKVDLTASESNTQKGKTKKDPFGQKSKQKTSNLSRETESHWDEGIRTKTNSIEWSCACRVEAGTTQCITNDGEDKDKHKDKESGDKKWRVRETIVGYVLNIKGFCYSTWSYSQHGGTKDPHESQHCISNCCLYSTNHLCFWIYETQKSAKGWKFFIKKKQNWCFFFLFFFWVDLIHPLMIPLMEVINGMDQWGQQREKGKVGSLWMNEAGAKKKKAWIFGVLLIDRQWWI